MLAIKTTSWRYELQTQNIETSVTKSARSTWRKHPDDLHLHIEKLKLQLVFVRLQRYIVGSASGVFLRSMGFLAREIGVSVRTMQRYCDALEEAGLLHRQEQRISRCRNRHNRFTLLNMDELYAGIRLSSSGRKFVGGYNRENLSLRKTGAACAKRTVPPKAKAPMQPRPSRGMRHVYARQRPQAGYDRPKRPAHAWQKREKPPENDPVTQQWKQGAVKREAFDDAMTEAFLAKHGWTKEMEANV
jgi:hypothetical protein